MELDVSCQPLRAPSSESLHSDTDSVIDACAMNMHWHTCAEPHFDMQLLQVGLACAPVDGCL